MNSEIEKIKASNESLVAKLQNITDILNEIQTTARTLSSSSSRAEGRDAGRDEDQDAGRDGDRDAGQAAEIKRLKFALSAVQELVKRAKDEVKRD